MKKIITLLSTITLTLSAAKADMLATLNVPNWTAYHATSIAKDHAFGIGPSGTIDLYFMKRDDKLNANKPVYLKLVIERKDKDGTKWVTKTIRKDGFIKPAKPTEDAEKVTIHGTVTGDVEYKIDFTFSKGAVLMKAAIVGEPKDAKTSDYRVSIVSKIDKFTTINKTDINDVKVIKSKTRGDELRIKTRENERSSTKVRFYEPIEIEKLEKEEIISIEAKAEKIGRSKLTWSLANPKVGSLKIHPTAINKMPYEGFEVNTVLVDDTGKKQSEGIILEYK